MAVRVKPGQSLLGDSRIRLKQIHDAFNSDENLQTCRIKLGVDLSNGVLLDIYCFVHAHVKELGASSVTNRLADILHYLGHSPPRDAKIARRWNKEANKLYDVFIKQRKTTYGKGKSKVPSTVYLAAAPGYQPLTQQRNQVICQPIHAAVLCLYCVAPLGPGSID